MNKKNKNLPAIPVIISFLILLFMISGCINNENEVYEKPINVEANKTNVTLIEEVSTNKKENTSEGQIPELELYCYLNCVLQKCQDKCYDDYIWLFEVIKNEGISYCYSVDGSIFRNVCIVITAAREKNVSLCDNINKSDSFYDECIGLVAATNKDISVCYKIEYDHDRVYSLGRDRCIGKIAMITKNLSLCDKTIEPDGKEGCIEGIATKMEDVTVCNKISTIEERENCIFNVATVLEDTSLCEKISTNKDKELCFTSIASIREDFTICQKIFDNERKEGCIHMVAWIKENSSICKEIQTLENREICFAAVASRTKISPSAIK